MEVWGQGPLGSLPNTAQAFMAPCPHCPLSNTLSEEMPLADLHGPKAGPLSALSTAGRCLFSLLASAWRLAQAMGTQPYRDYTAIGVRMDFAQLLPNPPFSPQGSRSCFLIGGGDAGNRNVSSREVGWPGLLTQGHRTEDGRAGEVVTGGSHKWLPLQVPSGKPHPETTEKEVIGMRYYPYKG